MKAEKLLTNGLLVLGALVLTTACYFANSYGQGDWELGDFNRFEYFRSGRT
jgi:hypothetical protein